MTLRLILAIAAILATGTARGDDGEEMLLPGGGHPATRPAAKPTTRPKATVSAEAEGTLKKLAGAYGGLKSLELTGTIQFQIDEAGGKHTDTAAFTSAFASPNRFRQEVQDQPLLMGTGEKIIGYSRRSNSYSQAIAPAGKSMLRDMPADHRKILPAQNLSLTLALSKDADAELRELTSDIATAGDEKIDGKTYATLKLTAAEDKAIMTLLLDRQTNLIRRVVTDYKPVLAKAGREDIASATMTVDYVTTKVNADLPAERFAWNPPAGARELTTKRMAVEDHAEDAESLTGKTAPDFTLSDLDGKAVKLSDMKGSVVVLDFWATWCGPCVQSLPNLDKVFQDNAKEGLKVFAVNLKEEKEKVREFVERKKLTMPILLDGDGAAAQNYGVQAIPMTVVIGKNGIVKKVLIGAGEENELRNAIAKELKGE